MESKPRLYADHAVAIAGPSQSNLNRPALDRPRGNPVSSPLLHYAKVDSIGFVAQNNDPRSPSRQAPH